MSTARKIKRPRPPVEVWGQGSNRHFMVHVPIDGHPGSYSLSDRTDGATRIKLMLAVLLASGVHEWEGLSVRSAYALADLPSPSDPYDEIAELSLRGPGHRLTGR